MIRKLKNFVRRISSNLFKVDLVGQGTFGVDILRDIRKILANETPRTVFDVGANVGTSSVEFARVFPGAQVFAFEPDPGTFDKLQRGISSYANQVKPYNLGLGSTPESRTLMVNKGSGGNSFLKLSPAIGSHATGDWTLAAGEVVAEIHTVDNFCLQNKIESIDLIKIDTQGYEMEVLLGGKHMITPSRTKLIHIEVLMVELYKNQAFFNEVMQELSSRGFQLVGFYNCFHKSERPHYLLWCDALFAGNVK